jgi:cyclohexanecarboxylate-CoA ligase
MRTSHDATDKRVAREEAREQLRRTWRADGWYADVTIGEALADGARRYPESELVFAAGDGTIERVTRASLHRNALATAGRLAGEGVSAGDAVVVQAPADRRGTEVLEALWLLGVTVVPLVATASAADVVLVLTQTAARTVVVARSWRGVDLPEQALAFERAGLVSRVLVLGDIEPDGATALGRGGPVADIERRRPDPGACACVLYTSGSTAAPKGVRHSHETLLAGLLTVPPDAAARHLAAFPAGHVASLLGLLRPLCRGGTTVVMDRWSARRAAALIEEHRLTASAGTPFFLATLLDEAERAGRDISSLRRFLCGAASVPPALVARAEAKDIVTWRTYGSTEHPAISAGGPDDPPEKRRLTDGRVGPGNEVRLLREDGSDARRGEEGEIVARGPKQFLGYQDTALDVEAFADTSWFRTGDLGRFDEDGYLVVTDRVKDIVIRGGENISAREVEDALATLASIDQVAVCAAPDERWGEVVCAFVVPTGGPAPTLEDTGAHLDGLGLAPHKHPVRLVVVDDLPRTATGKVLKQELRAQLRAASGGPS